MRKFILFLATMASCSSDIYVFTDYDKEFDIKSYQSYRWTEIKNIENNRNPVYYNEMNDKRIKSAVNKQLLLKGYMETADSAEMVLHYHIAVNDVIAYRDDKTFHHEATWLRPEIASYRYNEGTVIIDFMDATCKCLIWRGYASQTLDGNYPHLSEEKINEAISKILRDFPKRK